MKSEYKSGKSVGKNQTVPISVDDPRVSPSKIGQTKARMGAEIEIVGLDGKLLVMGGTSLAGASKPFYPAPPPSFPPNVWPPGGNEAPKTYPGGSGPFIIVPTNPANVVASWSGDDLVVTFDWDANNEYNVTISQFILEVTADGVTRRTPMNTFAPNKASTAQTATFTKTLNKLTFGLFRTKITSVCVLVADPLNNISQTICATSVGAYVLNLPVPVITLTGTTSGYSVGYTTPVSGPFDAIDVWEIESVDSTAPSVTFAADGITPTNYSRVYFDSLNPAQVPTGSTNKRWAMARFSSEGGIYTLFCDPKVVTPLSPVVADNEGPPDITSLTTSGGTDSTGTVGFNGYIDLTWSSITAGDIRGYRIRYRPVTTPVSKYSYADSIGSGTSYRLHGVSIGATYEIAVATYDQYNNLSSNYFSGNNVTIGGVPYIATETVNVSGYFKAKANSSDADSTAFKFGYGIQDSGPSQRGLRFNPYNYWRIDSDQSASIRVGGESSNYIEWSGADFLIDGNISARKGNFSGNVSIAGGGSLQSFITPPTVFSIDQVTYTSTAATYRTTAEHGYVIGDDILISGLLPVGYNGKFKITEKTLTTFTVANTTNAAVTDATGSVILITGTGFVLNKDGLAFNSSTIRDITTINAETGLFTTQSANIGGWQINSVTKPGAIYKTSISGKGNIILDSTNGYIAVSNSSIASSLAGINSPGNDLTHSVFWAGTTDPNSIANPFRVTLGGKLYATEADITGTVSSIGALGRMTLDGTHGYISLKTGTTGPTAYIVPRNDNIYITSPSATPPWNSDITKGINTSGPVNGPYFSAGSSFKDYWGNTTQGTGIYTGAWDYFSAASGIAANIASKPFVTATTTGVQISANAQVGILVDSGSTATGDKLNPAVGTGIPSILMYTSKQTTAPYSPSTVYGAWASFTPSVIKLTADTYTFINIDGTPSQKQILIKSTENIGALFDSTGIMINIDSDTFQEFRNDYIKLQATSTVHETLDSSGIKIQSTADIWQRFDASGIRLQSTSSVYQTFDSSKITLYSGLNRGAGLVDVDANAYGYANGYYTSAYSKIELNSDGVKIYGTPWQGDISIAKSATANYLGLPPMGPYARQRMIVEDPANGYQKLGMAVYYVSLNDYSGTPTNSTGVVGDLVVQW
jgi:hypothetical protein